MNARRLALAALCVALGALLVTGSSAQAAFKHEYLSQLTGFGEVGAIAFDAQGDVYVADRNTKTVDRLSATGVPLPFTASEPYLSGAEITGSPDGAFIHPEGVAVNEETGEIYVSDDLAKVVYVYSSTGEYISQITGPPSTAPVPGPFEAPTSLAMDQVTHDLYVVDKVQGNNVADDSIDVFSAAGAYLRQIGTILPDSVGVNELTGEVYSGKQSPNFEPGTVSVFDQFGTPVSPPWVGAHTSAGYFEHENVFIGIDPPDQHVYVASTAFEAAAVVDEFAASPTEEYEGDITGTPSGPLKNITAIAINPVNGYIYVSVSHGSDIDVFGPDITVPDATTGAAVASRIGKATLEGSVNPDGVESTSCEFEWGASTALGQNAPCSSAALTGSEPVEVQAELNGLQADTTYYYRLRAKNDNGSNAGNIQHFLSAGPKLASESTTNVAATSATLNGSIDPNGAPVFYYFEYGATSGYGTEVPLRSGSAVGQALGSGHGEVEFSQHVQNLSPGVIYHYRVVAVSEPAPGEYETFDGTDQTFTTQASGSPFVLPDDRQWEMVSPVEKQGALLLPITQSGVIQSSLGGEAITYYASQPLELGASGNTSPIYVQELSRRGAHGWESKTIATPHDATLGPYDASGNGSEYRFFSSDLSLGLVEPQGPFTSLSAEDSERTEYLRHDLTCEASPATCYQPLVSGAPGHENVPVGTHFGVSHGFTGAAGFVGATPDLSHVILSSTVGLTSTPGDNGGLYEWAGGKLRLVSMLPEAEGGGPAQGGNAYLGEKESSGNKNTRDAVSTDGSRVFWTQKNQSGRLFLRDMTHGNTGETIRIDLAESGVTEAGLGAAKFQAASSDGSRVFFSDTEALTKNSQDSGELYECDVVESAGKLACDLTDLTSNEAGKPAAALGVLGVSTDGSYVYFVADGALVSGAPTGPDVYMRHDGITTFIAGLSGADYPDWASGLEHQTASVTGDGQWLAFMSLQPLTGYDNDDAVTGVPDEEVFLYDAESKRLVCASCNPTGARPTGVSYGTEYGQLYSGDRVWSPGYGIAANIPAWTPYALGSAAFQSRYLSSSGRLFFNSSDALVPQDVDGTEDVYEYEPVGVGNCTASSLTFSANSDGCVDLVSAGTSAEESGFVDASESGADVFFLTSSKLASQDVGDERDLYDAHECSNTSPCPPVVAVTPPPCTTGDACKAAPSPQPSVYGAPSSETFSGAGNVTPTVTGGSVAARSLTAAQKLAVKLKACRKRTKRKRPACEKQARVEFKKARSRETDSKKKGKG